MRRKKAYICQTAFNHDLADDNYGTVKIYGSLDAIKADTTCWEECGIYEISINVEKVKVKAKEIKRLVNV